MIYVLDLRGGTRGREHGALTPVVLPLSHARELIHNFKNRHPPSEANASLRERVL